MKICKSALWGIISGMLLAGFVSFVSAEEPLADKNDYWTFTSIVQEWTASDRLMVIEDKQVTVNAVWMDKGTYDKEGKAVLRRAGTSYIKEGSPVTVEIKAKRNDGILVANRIIVYRGKGVKKVQALLPQAQTQETKDTPLFKKARSLKALE